MFFIHQTSCRRIAGSFDANVRKLTMLAVTVLFGAVATTKLQAQLVTIDTVFVGDAGNAAANSAVNSTWGDGNFGAVDYNYRIGRSEVTLNEYTAFLNATAVSDPYWLYNPSMSTNPNSAGISRTGSSGSYSYSVIGSGSRPVTYVSWFDAARFSNWLHNGATFGASTETGAYTLNGATNGVFTVNSGAQWWIPSEDEWVKAAYYDPGTGNYSLHANQSNSLTTNTIGAAGGANYFDGDYATTQNGSFSSGANYLTDAGAYSDSGSFYGTFDQGGNVWEWNDAIISDSSRGQRGGSWVGPASFLQATDRFANAPTVEFSHVGFRVASIPEPSTVVLMIIGVVTLLILRRRRATR